MASIRIEAEVAAFGKGALVSGLDHAVDDDAGIVLIILNVDTFTYVELHGHGFGKVGEGRFKIHNRRRNMSQRENNPLTRLIVQVPLVYPAHLSHNAQLIVGEQVFVEVIQLNGTADGLAAGFDYSELNVARLGLDLIIHIAWILLAKDAKVLLAVHVQLLRLNHEQEVPGHLVVYDGDVTQLEFLLVAFVLVFLMRIAHSRMALNDIAQLLLGAVLQAKELLIEILIFRIHLE